MAFGGDDSGKDLEAFLELFNGIGPAKQLNLKDFHAEMKKAAATDMVEKHERAKLANVLLGPVGVGESEGVMKRVPTLTRLLPSGDPTNSTTSAPTLIRNDNAIAAPRAWVIICDFDEIQRRADAAGPTSLFALCVRTNKELLKHFSGRTLDIALTDEAPDNISISYCNRILQQFLSLVNGTHGCKYKMKYPAIIRRIEVSRPMSTSLKGLWDAPGAGENNRAVAAGRATETDSGVITSVIIHTDESVNEAAEYMEQPNTKVIVMYNQTKSKNDTYLQNQSPVNIAQLDNHASAGFMKNVDKTLRERAEPLLSSRRNDARNADDMFTVIKADVVSGAAIMELLRVPNLIGVGQLEGLALTLKATNAPDMILAVEEAQMEMSLRHVHLLDQLSEAMESMQMWTDASFPGVDPRFASALAKIEAKKIGTNAMNLAFGGSKHLWTSAHLDKQRIMQVVKEEENAAQQIRLNDLDALLCAIEKPETATPGQTAIFHRLVDRFIGECSDKAVPYQAYVRVLKEAIVEAGKQFLLMARDNVQRMGIKVDLSVDPSVMDSVRQKSIHEVLGATINVTSISFGDQAIHEEAALRDHAKVFMSMGDCFMNKIVEGMAMSTTKKAVEEPTIDLVTQSLLLFLRAKPKKIREALRKKDQGEAIIGLMYCHLKRAFCVYPMKYTALYMEEHHPGRFVTGVGAMQSADEREALTNAMRVVVTGQQTRTISHLHQACFSPNLAMSFVKMAKAIALPQRIGLKKSDHAPFPEECLPPRAAHEYEYEQWTTTLGAMLNSSSLWPIEEEVKAAIVSVVHSRYNVDITTLRHYEDVRDAIGHVMGFQSRWEDRTDFETCLDAKDSCFFSQADLEGYNDALAKDAGDRPSVDSSATLSSFSRSRTGTRASMQKLKSAQERIYGQKGPRTHSLKYVTDLYDRFQVPSAVKHIGRACAYAVPSKLSLSIDGEHPATYYIPNSHGEPITVHDCFDEEMNLLPNDEIGVPEDLYGFFTENPIDVRRALERYDQKDLAKCIGWEVLVAAVTSNKAIAFLILSDDAKDVVEYVFWPQLYVRPLPSCADILRHAVIPEIKVMAERTEVAPVADRCSALDIIVAYGCQFFLLQGTYKNRINNENEGGDGNKRPRSEEQQGN